MWLRAQLVGECVLPARRVVGIGPVVPPRNEGRRAVCWASVRLLPGREVQQELLRRRGEHTTLQSIVHLARSRRTVGPQAVIGWPRRSRRWRWHRARKADELRPVALGSICPRTRRVGREVVSDVVRATPLLGLVLPLVQRRIAIDRSALAALYVEPERGLALILCERALQTHLDEETLGSTHRLARCGPVGHGDRAAPASASSVQLDPPDRSVDVRSTRERTLEGVVEDECADAERPSSASFPDPGGRCPPSRTICTLRRRCSGSRPWSRLRRSRSSCW